MDEKDSVKEIKVWGFPASNFDDWPDDLQPVSSGAEVTAGDQLLLVHSSAAQEYAKLARSLDEPPTAILYLEAGANEPREAWRYFRSSVNEGDWRRLRALVECPRQLETAQVAREVPASRLDEALTLLSAGEGGSKFAQMPLPGDAADDFRDHLATCATCRKVFEEVLRARQEWSDVAYHPSIEQLGFYARSRETLDPSIERHLENCASCSAKVKVLRRLAMPRWQTVTLRALADLYTKAEAGIRETGRTMAALVADFAGAVSPMQPIKPLLGYMGSVEASPNEAERAVVTLVGDDGQLNLRWSPGSTGDKILWVERLYNSESEPLREFEVELRGEVGLLWSGTSQAGRVSIPVADLEEAIEQGADQLVLLIKTREQR